MQYGVGHFPVGDDGGAALLRSPPCCVHFCGHSPPPPGTLVPELDVSVQLRAVGVYDPADLRSPEDAHQALIF